MTRLNRLSAALTCVIAFCFAFAVSAQVGLASTTLQVNLADAGDQIVPAIDSGRVVWQDDNYSVIRTRNLGTGVEETVSATGADNVSPDVSGSRVVWNRAWREIMMKDMGTSAVSTITASSSSDPPGLAFLPNNPAISGNTVVWEDYRSTTDPGDVYGRTIGGAEYGVQIGLGLQYQPDVSGSYVVWSDSVSGNYDIKMKRSGALANVTTASGDQKEPAVSGSICVWQDKRGATNDIYAKNVSPGTYPENVIAGDINRTLTAAASAGATIINLTTSGFQVGDHIKISTTGKEQWLEISQIISSTQLRLTTSLVDSYPSGSAVKGLWEQTSPAVYANGTTYRAVWEDNRKSAPAAIYDIYMYDSTTGQTTPVVVQGGTSQEAPAISGDAIVWQDNRNGDWDIYMLVGPPIVTDDGAWTASPSALHASWTWAGLPTRYEYAIGTSSGATDTRTWTDVGLSREITATGLGLVNGTSYYVSVRAFDGSGYSDVGTADGIRVDTQAPTVPGSTAATAGNGTAQVTWTASTDALSGFNHYVVYRGTSQGGPYTSVANRTLLSFDDSGLANGTTYWYRVTGVDNVGNESAQSSEASATPKAPAPVVTDDGTFTASSTSLHASWTPVAGATSYDYAVGTSAGGTNTRDWTNTGGASAEITATGLALASAETYFISIRARNGDGNVSSQVGSSNGITVDTEGPAAPTGVGVAAGNTTATVRWDAATDPSGIDHYVVYRSDDDGTSYPTSFTATNLSYEDSGLTNGNTYFYKVSAVDTLNHEGPASAEASVTPNQSETTLTVGADVASVFCGGSVTLSGDLASNDVTLTPIETNDIHIEHQLPGLDWQAIATTVTSDGSGHYDFTFEPTSNASYRAVWLGDGMHNGAVSSEVSVSVRAVVTLGRSSSLVISSRTWATWNRLYRYYLALYRRTRSVRYYRLYRRYYTYLVRYGRYRSVLFYGSTAPARPYKLVYITYKSGTVWRNLLAAGSVNGYYARRWWPRNPGTFYIRTHFPADANNLDGYSGYIKLVVR